MSEAFAANRSWTPELDRKARALSWLLLDVDGVLTDGRLHLSAAGEAFKSFHVRDGLAVKLARSAGFSVGILSARDSAIVAARAIELGVDEVVQGREDKGAAFRELLDRCGTQSFKRGDTSSERTREGADRHSRLVPRGERPIELTRAGRNGRSRFRAALRSQDHRF